METEAWIKREGAVEVEAVRLNEDNVEAVARWCGGDLVEEIDPVDGEIQFGINVRTPAGIRRASFHMYVLRFGGAFYTVQPRQFEEVYIPVNRDAPPPESAGDTRQRLGFANPFGT